MSIQSLFLGAVKEEEHPGGRGEEMYRDTGVRHILVPEYAL